MLRSSLALWAYTPPSAAYPLLTAEYGEQIEALEFTTVAPGGFGDLTCLLKLPDARLPRPELNVFSRVCLRDGPFTVFGGEWSDPALVLDSTAGEHVLLSALGGGTSLRDDPDDSAYTSASTAQAIIAAEFAKRSAYFALDADQSAVLPAAPANTFTPVYDGYHLDKDIWGKMLVTLSSGAMVNAALQRLAREVLAGEGSIETMRSRLAGYEGTIEGLNQRRRTLRRMQETADDNEYDEIDARIKEVKKQLEKLTKERDSLEIEIATVAAAKAARTTIDKVTGQVTLELHGIQVPAPADGSLPTQEQFKAATQAHLQSILRTAAEGYTYEEKRGILALFGARVEVYRKNDMQPDGTHWALMFSTEGVNRVVKAAVHSDNTLSRISTETVGAPPGHSIRASPYRALHMYRICCPLRRASMLRPQYAHTAYPARSSWSLGCRLFLMFSNLLRSSCT